MSFAHFTPEQRRAAQEKSAATRAANKAKRLSETAPTQEPDTAEPLVLTAEPEDVYDGLLTDAEKAAILKEARAKAREDQRKAVKAAYVKEMMEQARRELGEEPENEADRRYNEELVRVFVDMPRMRKPTGGEQDPEPIIIDQTVYVSGRSYEMPRGKAVYIHYLMDQVRRHVNQVDGRSRTYYSQGTGQMIYQGGPAVGGGSLGASFEAIHKRRN